MTIPLPEKHYWVTDNTGYGEEISSRAGPEQIAAEWFASGTCDQEDRTTWVRVEVFEIDETADTTGLRASRTFAVDPPAPECVEPAHDWRSPPSVVGGVPESPGTYGHGGWRHHHHGVRPLRHVPGRGQLGDGPGQRPARAPLDHVP